MPWDSAAAFLRVCSDEHQSRDREDTVDLAVRSIGCSGYLKGIIDSQVYMSSTVLKGRYLPEGHVWSSGSCLPEVPAGSSRKATPSFTRPISRRDEGGVSMLEAALELAPSVVWS
jgi:hypothetical protein